MISGRLVAFWNISRSCRQIASFFHFMSDMITVVSQCYFLPPAVIAICLQRLLWALVDCVVHGLHCVPSVLWRCWLVGRKGIQPVKNRVVGCWCGCLSGARCILAYRPADATATHCLFASVKSRLVLPFWFRLTWVVPDKGLLNGCVCVCVCVVCTVDCIDTQPLHYNNVSFVHARFDNKVHVFDLSTDLGQKLEAVKMSIMLVACVYDDVVEGGASWPVIFHVESDSTFTGHAWTLAPLVRVCVWGISYCFCLSVN